MSEMTRWSLIVAGTFLVLGLVHLIPGWWRKRQTRAECFHHDHNTGTSWITAQLIDMGSRKIFTCDRCRKMWFS